MLNLCILYCKLVVVGIFVVQVYGLIEKLLFVVVSIGVCLMVDDFGCVLLEVYIFDYYVSVYGKLVCVEFMKKLCDEVCYDLFDVFKDVIVQDCVYVWQFFGLFILLVGELLMFWCDFVIFVID